MEKIKKFKGKIYEPYPHQVKIEEILEQMNDKGNFSTIVTVPTGGGKTRSATDFCLKALENSNNKVLWMSDTVDLLGQAIGSFEENNKLRELNYQLVCGTAITREKDGSFGRSGKGAISVSADKISTEADVVFASVETVVQEKNYESIANWLRKVQENGRIYCIYDEVHHIGAEKTENFLSKLFGVADGKTVLTNFALVGLTATVYRHDSPIKSFNRWFKDGYVNGQICKDDTIYGVGADTYINNRVEVTSIKELTDAKLLMKPKIIRIDDFKKGIPETNDAAMSYLSEKIKANYTEENWNKTIVFVDGIGNATLLNKKLGEAVPSFVYTSETLSGVENDLNDFKKTDGTPCKVMIAVDMVSEGFDVKDIETIYLFSRVSSQILIRQRVGRVLRIAKNKKKATVYWQNYFDYEKPKTIPEYTGDFSKNDYEEDDLEIQRDIGRWRKGYQLPAGMYLEELPRDIEAEREFAKRYEYLHVLDLFGLDAVLHGIGYFKFDENKIYVGAKEKKGYKQFYRVIVSDYYSLLMLQDKYAKFSDYAKALGVSTEELLEDIKLNCFYMSNSSLKDTTGKIANKEFSVSDDQIKKFYEWVIANDLVMPKFEEISSIESGSETEPKENQKELVMTGDDSCNIAIFKAYFEMNKKKPASDIFGGIKLYQEFVNHSKCERTKNTKVYPDILTYGKKSDVLYYEMMSAQAIMKVGAVAEQREQGTLRGVTGSIALVSKDKSGKYEATRMLARTTKDLTDDDLLLAQALVTVPNHICVKIKDVKDYRDIVINSLQIEGIDVTDKKKIAREFLMALGYSHNDGFIRMQVELFGEKLPRILQYVIYCKAYDLLSNLVSYYKNEIPQPEAINVPELENAYKTLLQDYGVKQLDEDLCPVKDVLTDYRPYIKAVKYYQGIKPEFLCRMLNEMLRLGKKEGFVFTDGFGGSGTISLNIDSNLKMKQEYNDLGILNEALFMTLKNNGGQALKDRVANFIDLILNHTGDEKAARDFLSPYSEVIKNKKYKFASDTLVQIEADYQKDFAENVANHNSKPDIHKWLSLDERLANAEQKYASILRLCYKEVETQELRVIEEYLHAILLIVGAIYNELKDTKKEEKVDISKEDLAFIFFMYYFLSNRQFYNDATIDKFADFVGSYEQYIDNASLIVSQIKIHREDANELTAKLKKDADRIWYYDIPYSETDVSNYSSDWFDEAKFVKELGKSKGDYIVASRYNICDGRKGGLDAIKKDGEIRKLSNKHKNIIKFFLRFVSKEFASQYEQDVKDNSTEEENEKPDYTGKDANPWSHISGSRTAKYIVFAFSNTEQKLGDDGKTKFEKNYLTVSKDSIRRMLKNTQISNIEVEIMLTNMKLDMKMLPVKCVEDGIWYVPSFKTQSNYKIEPVTIIMDYKLFIKEMVLFTISENLYKSSEEKNIAAYFRERYR
ncbi:MAG: DEAD/DEAH box helicase [Lachnospiraceae bacterium]